MLEELNYSEEELDGIMDAIMQGATLSDAINMDPGALEAGYGLAYSLYTAGNYTDAETMFKGLCLYNYNDTRFWMGLGGCRQALNDLEGAVKAYGSAICTSGLGDPAPVVYGGLCQLKMGNKDAAVELFKAALDMGEKDQTEHAPFHQKARAMLEMLEKGA